MRVFLLDLWLDLREKRLAPVAIALLAGIIAVPIVLANGEEEPPPPPATTTTAAAPGGPVIESQADEGPVDSKLQTFSPRDPFEPVGGSGAATTTTTTTPAGGTTSGTTTPTGGGTTTTGGGTSGGGTSGGGTTGSGPSTGTGTGNTGNTTGGTRTRVFTYTVDLRFGPGGAVKKYSKVNRLQLIPDEDDPKLVFLGVTTTGKTAVFLVDSSIGVDTEEGRCRPSPDECSFLYLRPDEEHDQATLTDSDGQVFQMRLLDIDRISVSSADGGGGSGSGDTTSDRSPAFTGNAKSTDEDDATVPGETPPGESQPERRSSFQQFFADGGNE